MVVESVDVSERPSIDFVLQSELTGVQYRLEAYQRCPSLVSLVGVEVVVYCWTNWCLKLVLSVEEGRHYVSEVY